jgi:hypothetical protein
VTADVLLHFISHATQLPLKDSKRLLTQLLPPLFSLLLLLLPITLVLKFKKVSGFAVRCL